MHQPFNHSHPHPHPHSHSHSHPQSHPHPHPHPLPLPHSQPIGFISAVRSSVSHPASTNSNSNSNTSTSSSSSSSPIPIPSGRTSQVIMFPTRAGVKQRVSIQQPAQSNIINSNPSVTGSLTPTPSGTATGTATGTGTPISTSISTSTSNNIIPNPIPPSTSRHAHPRPPMVPVAISANNLKLSLLSTTPPRSRSRPSPPHRPPSNSNSLSLSHSHRINSFSSARSGSAHSSSHSLSSPEVPSSASFSDLPASDQIPLSLLPLHARASTEPLRSHPYSLSHSRQPSGSSLLSNSSVAHLAKISTPSSQRFLSSDKPSLNPPPLPHSSLNINQSVDHKPLFQLALQHSSTSTSLIDLDFGPSFSATSSDLASCLGNPSISPPPTIHRSSSDSDRSSSSRSTSVSDSNQINSLHNQRRDTLRSFSDVLNPPIPQIKSSDVLIPPNSSRTPNVTPVDNRTSTFQPSNSPPPSRPIPLSHPTPKPSSAPSTAPSLLDLDISGRGPSLGFGKVGSQEEDEDERHVTPKVIRPPRSTSNVPSHHRAASEDDDPYLSGNALSDDDDDRSIQYDGSSSDDHQPASEHAQSPYMTRHTPHSHPAPSTHTRDSRTGSSNGALKKGLQLFKLNNPRSDSNHHRHESQPANPRSDKPDYVDPSPVSSMTSFNTIGSKSSSKISSSSRMARLISRVTGTTSLSSLSAAAKRAPIDPANQGPSPPASAPAQPQRAPIKRKGSLSNLLDTITISRDKSKPASQPAQPTRQPSIAPRKSFEMLMRPVFGKSRPQATVDVAVGQPSVPKKDSSPVPLPSEGPSAPTKRLLKGKRSYDMLRAKLGSGRKSMDDLSNAPRIDPEGMVETKKLTASSPLLSETAGSELAPSPALSVPKMGRMADSTPAPSAAKASGGPAPKPGAAVSRTRGASATSKPSGEHTLSKGAPPEGGVPGKEPVVRVLDYQAVKEWEELETLLTNFQVHHMAGGLSGGAAGRADLTAGLTGVLVPFLKSEEARGAGWTYVDQARGVYHRKILFGWLDLIFNELREPQPTSRGACLDGVSDAVKQYRAALVSVLSFAIDKLNDKAVYANTLVFAGRMLSLAFFRIEGVGRKLLRALPPVKRMSMRRLLDEMGAGEGSVPSERPNFQPFPSYLRELCFVDLSSYCRVFSMSSNEVDNFLVQEGEIRVEMSGNWLIRWTASDSDLPFAFYRAYHRQLATYLRPQQHELVDPSTLISMPGFLFICASFLDKCDSLVHRSLRSVTTLGPSGNQFNAGESANLAMGAKPKVLELAHRRLVSTALDIVGGSPRLVDPLGGMDDLSRRRKFFGGLLNLWIRAIAKRTSMWDTRSVFLLLDFLDGLFYTVLYTAPASHVQAEGGYQQPGVPKLVESSLELFDLRFILDIVRRVLVTADNTVCVMRTIAFVYSQFEALTTQPKILHELCMNLLLDPKVFEHLFLHWNSGVRGYYMRLLVWRLSRLGGMTNNTLDGGDAGKGGGLRLQTEKSKEVIKIILTFNARLDAIRKRHDELSPESEFLTLEQDEHHQRRTTICSTRGVSDQPWAIDELPPEEVCSEAVEVGGSERAREGPGAGEKPSVAKVVSWLKVVKRLGGSSRTKNSRQDSGSEVRPLAEQTASVVGPGRLMEEPNQLGGQTDQMREEEGRGGAEEVGQTAGLSELESEQLGSSPRKSGASHSQHSAHAQDSPTFFKFEFELGADIPRSDSFDTPATSATGGGPGSSENGAAVVVGEGAKGPTAGAGGKKGEGNGGSGGPRVSSRFSKRASLLPPAALSMLKDNEVPAVPAVPDEFTRKGDSISGVESERVGVKEQAYSVELHAYAVRALAEYEQSLEEEFEWKEKVLEEAEEEAGLVSMVGTGGGGGEQQQGSAGGGGGGGGGSTSSSSSGLENIVPRLAVSWPLSFSEDE